MHFRCAAVLFDCDGVLVDSDTAVDAAWRRWAHDMGIDADELLAGVHGRRSLDTVVAWVPSGDVGTAVACIDRYEIEYAEQVSAVPGAASLLAAMPVGAWAVVTSGTRALAVARLRAAGLPIPDVLVTADDVVHGKPAPEGYARAARKLAVAADSTVVVEDAAAGMRAARDAGVSAVVGVGARADGGQPDVRVADLRAVRWTDTGLDVHPV